MHVHMCLGMVVIDSKCRCLCGMSLTLLRDAEEMQLSS